MAVSETTKRNVWVRAGGRCVLCRGEVLDETIAPISIADVAHAAGQGTGPKTPRLMPEMPLQERDAEENLLLLCKPCHTKVDNKTLEAVYDLPALRERKVEHEKLVRHLLSLMDSAETLVLRMVGDVRGTPVSATRLEVGAATAARGRVPTYLDRHHRSELEIDLTGVEEADPSYWEVQRRRIETGVALALDALRSGTVDHLTVFAFARLPLLVLLGWLLDDTLRVDVVQRSREHGWQPEPVGGFSYRFESQVAPAQVEVPEALLVLQISGTPDLQALPGGLTDLLRTTISPLDLEPNVNIADSEGTRERFDHELRRVLGMLEERLVRPTVLHVVAAAPISIAVALGRAIDPQVFPTVHIYDLNDDHRYRRVLTLDSKDRRP